MRALRRTMLVILAVVAGGAGAASALAADSTFTASATRAAQVVIPPTTAFTGGGGLLRIGAGGRSRLGRAAVRLTCHAPDGLPCTIGIAVANGRHIVAKARKVLGGTTKLYLRLNGYARAKLAHHFLKVFTVAVARDHHGHAAVAGFTGKLQQIVVRRP